MRRRPTKNQILQKEREREKKKRASTTMRTLFEAPAAPGKEAEGAEVDFFCFFAFAAAFFPISSLPSFML